MTDWKTAPGGDEHAAHQERVYDDSLRQALFRALNAAGPCPLCGWSGTVAVYDYHCPDCGVEGMPLTGSGLGWAACINATCPRSHWELEPKEEPCPNGCEQRR